MSTTDLVPEALWALIAPLLPKPKRRRFRFPGRKRLDDRRVLAGILFILKSGLPWNDLPREFGCGCGSTCYHRLRAWQRRGVWTKIHQVLLAELRHADQIDWSRAVVDSISTRALKRGPYTGRNPTDRGKQGVKHHTLVDGQGTPISSTITGANQADITQRKALVAAIPAVGGKPGPPKRHFAALYGDRGYDSEPHRDWLRAQQIEPHLAKRRTPHGSGLGIVRWVVERTQAWKLAFRKLRVSTDRLPSVHRALDTLANAIICWRILQWA
jgi:transposase